MVERKQEPVFNAAGTHVFMRNFESGDLYECPADHVAVALARGFFELAPAPVDDGVHEDEAAPKKKAATKTSGD